MCLIDTTVKATDIAIVLATIAGPILAVWASDWRQARKASRDRQEWVFRTLWSTRSTGLHPDHVMALNHIEFAFPMDKHRKVDDAWRLYQAHLNTPQGYSQESVDRWNEKAYSLLVDLVHLMASDLGFPFSKSSISNRSYSPTAYAISAERQVAIQEAMLAVLRGDKPIHVSPPKET